MVLSKHIKENLLETLADIGLGESEVHVLTALLLANGAYRVSTLAKRMGMNRTTLYPILKSLSAKGLVSSVEESGVLAYRSIQPHLLADYIERLREKLSADVKKVRDAAPLIQAEQTRLGHTYPSIQFFEGMEGVKKVLEDTIVSNRSKLVYGFSGTDATYKIGGVEWILDYIKRRAKSGIMRHEIAIESAESRRSQKRDHLELRETKILPPGYHFDVELSIYEHKVLIISFDKDRPLAVLIEDEKIAEVMKELFRFINTKLGTQGPRS